MEGLPQIGGVTVGRSPQCTPLSSDEIDQFFGQPLPVSAAPNATGFHGQRTNGPASANSTGTPSTPADSAPDAGISGKSPDVSSVE